jgi:hypothetical protein
MTPRFDRCRTCGRWTPRARLTSEGRCCPECAQVFSVCANCGRVFPHGEGFDDEHCSRECTTRYVIVRNYGPRPFTLATEE